MLLSEARTPGVLALGDGVPIPGLIAARVTSSAASAADRVQLQFAFGAAPSGYWSEWMVSRLEVRVAVDGEWASLFLGVADLIEFDLVQGIVEIEGRDLTALLIDQIVEQTYPNQTSSDMASALAGSVGLTPVVSPTSTLVGRYWQSEWSRSALGNYGKVRSAWDLLRWLASQEQYDVFVSGRKLYFHPPPLDISDIVTISRGDCIGLKLERSLRLAGDIKIIVRSWNSRTKQAFSSEADVAGYGGQNWRKIYVRPNLQIADAEQIALYEANELSRHERLVFFTLPGELKIGVRDHLVLVGTGLDFDQGYLVEEIERVIDSDRGFIEHVRVRAATAGRSAVIAG